MTDEFRTVRVAEELLATSTRDTWKLADAVLYDAPELGKGGNQRKEHALLSLDEQLAIIVERLDDLGITTPTGDPYTAGSLGYLRKTAMAWPQGQRHDRAAFRTHQEAGMGDGRGRVALAALCAIADGKRTRRPDEIDEASWDKATAAVRAKLARTRPPRFAVAANDLRRALHRQPNVPGRDEEPPESIVEGLAYIARASEALRAFAISFADFEVTEQHRAELGQALRVLVSTATELLDVVTAKADDAALASLIAEEEQR